MVKQGQLEQGIAEMRQGLAAVQATGMEVGIPGYLILLIEAHGRGGQIEEGLAMVSEALSAAEKFGARSYDARLYRLKGELLRQKVESKGQMAEIETEVETCFRKALEISRRQETKSFELQAAMSLSRLWQKQGKREEARDLLSKIYNWFTEGFDTADLKDAKALLEELS